MVQAYCFGTKRRGSLCMLIVHRFNKFLQLRAEFYLKIIVFPHHQIYPGGYYPRLCFCFQRPKPLNKIASHAHRPLDAIGKASFIIGVNSTTSSQPFAHQITKSASDAIILGFALSSKTPIRLLSALNFMIEPHPAI
jgi:hypothetical protein